MDEEIKTAFISLLLAWLVLRAYFFRRNDSKIIYSRNNNLDRVMLFLNFFTMAVIPMLAALNLLEYGRAGIEDSMRIAALFFYGLNIIFFFYIHSLLGKNWSGGLDIKEGQKLIKKGIYRKIRHPMYAHFWILVILQGIVLDNWIVAIPGIVSWCFLYFSRTGREEKMMIEKFGDEYREYMKKTGKIFPIFMQPGISEGQKPEKQARLKP